MASLRYQLPLAATADEVWSVVRDVGAVHQRFAPGFVADCRLAGDGRVVTFADGTVVREFIVSVDDDRRRLAYAVIDSPLGLRHHHATFEVIPDGVGTRLVWTADVLPDEAADDVAALMAEGARAIGAALGVRHR
jgi:hypothetical protein